jgi:hypothetical protein
MWPLAEKFHAIVQFAKTGLTLRSLPGICKKPAFPP